MARTRLRFLLVTAQIAASLMLLTGAALLLRSLWKMQAAPLGFSADNVIAVPLTLGRQGYREPAQRVAFFEQVEQMALRMPGVTAAAMADSIPPSGQVAAMIYSLIEVEGRPRAPQGTGGMVPWRLVTPGFFAALRIPVVRGRTFTEDDRRPGQDAVILGEGLARRLFGEQEALGMRLRFGGSPAWHTVVGIAATVNNNGFAPAEPEYYLPRHHPGAAPVDSRAREAQRSATLVIRSSWSAAAAGQWLKHEMTRLDPSLPISVQPMPDRVAELTAGPRFQSLLLAAFAVLGLVLAAVGLYGVVAFLVTQRTREMGVRLALGASPGGVTALVVREALGWSAAGLVAGLAGSWFAARLLEAMLYRVSARDPATWALSAAVLLAVAAAAAWVPARRAGRVDPVVALRAD